MLTIQCARRDKNTVISFLLASVARSITVLKKKKKTLIPNFIVLHRRLPIPATLHTDEPKCLLVH